MPFRKDPNPLWGCPIAAEQRVKSREREKLLERPDHVRVLDLVRGDNVAWKGQWRTVTKVGTCTREKGSYRERRVVEVCFEDGCRVDFVTDHLARVKGREVGDV